MSNIKWESWDEPVSLEEIKKVETTFSVKFPKEYIEIAMEYHGGHVSPHLFQVEGKERVFGTLLSFDREVVEHTGGLQ
jgi:SMI1-KNR4 cell-wall